MDFKKVAHKCRLLAIVLLCCCLTGCWDLVEINDLAVVNLLGVDKDPETGKMTTYYQVVNPGGGAAKKAGGIKSPVYSYRLVASTPGQFRDIFSSINPRRLFPNHYQALIVTERFARAGLREEINFIEKQYNRRATVYLLVTDAPIAEIMNTYTPLERLPGRSVRSIVDIQSKESSVVSRQSRVKDLAENLESSKPTVLPFVRLVGSEAESTTGRYEHMDAIKGNIYLSGGAIFRQDRMIGKLSPSEISWYHLLNERAGALYQTLIVGGDKVDVRARDITVHKRLSLSAGYPILNLNVDAKLELVNNDQNVKLTVHNLSDIKQIFNQQVTEKAGEFFKEMTRKGWDVLGIDEQINRKGGEAWENMKKDKDVWMQTKLELTVNGKITSIGTTIDPFREKGK